MIDIEVIIPQEPNESDIEICGDGDGETRRRANRSNQRYSRHHSLGREQQHSIAQGKLVFQHRRSNDLVQGIVAPHILANIQQLAVGREQRAE